MSSQNPKRPLQNPSAVGKKRMRGTREGDAGEYFCISVNVMLRAAYSPDHHVNEVIGDKSSQNPKRPLPNPSAIGKKRMRGACKGDAGEYLCIFVNVTLRTAYSPDHASEVIGNKSSQNPKRPLQNPSAIGKKRMRGTRKGDAGEYFRISVNIKLTTPHSPDHANEVVGNMSSQNPKRPLPNPSAVGKKRMRGTREGDAGEYFRISVNIKLTTPHSPDHANEVIGNMSSQNPKRPLPNPSAVGKKRMRGTHEGDAGEYFYISVNAALTTPHSPDHHTNRVDRQYDISNPKRSLQISSAVGKKRMRGTHERDAGEYF